MQNLIYIFVLGGKYDPDMFLTAFMRSIQGVWKHRGVNVTEALGKAHNDEDKTWQQKTTSLQTCVCVCLCVCHLLVNKNY